MLEFIIIIVVILLSYSILPTLLYKLNHKLFKKNNKDKVLYLTFDDGPSKKYTYSLLDLLKKHNIRATFFVVATFAKENPEIINRMKKEGHVIGLHSLEHKNALIKGRLYTANDFKRSMEIMKELGVDVKYYRPPWGHFNINTALQIKKYKLKYVLWDVMAEDWKGNTSHQIIAQKLIRRSHSGDIICLHDGRGENEAPSRTIKALSISLQIWKNNGYKFMTMEEYYE